MKASKTAVPNTIKNFEKKHFQDSKKQAVRAFLALEINVLSGKEEVSVLRSLLKKIQAKMA